MAGHEDHNRLKTLRPNRSRGLATKEALGNSDAPGQRSASWDWQRRASVWSGLIRRLRHASRPTLDTAVRLKELRSTGGGSAIVDCASLLLAGFELEHKKLFRLYRESA